MKEQSFAKRATKLLIKKAITRDEILENCKGTDLFSYHSQRVHVHCISKKRKREEGKKKERHSSTIITVILYSL